MSIANSEDTKTPEEIAVEYVKQFKFDFDCSVEIKENEYPMITRLYEVAIQEYSTSKLYRKIIKEIVSIQDEIISKYSNENRILFEKWNELVDRLHSDELLQIFIMGFCCSKQISEERNKKIKI